MRTSRFCSSGREGSENPPKPPTPSPQTQTPLPTEADPPYVEPLPLDADPPGSRSPEADPPGCRAPPPRCRHSLVGRPSTTANRQTDLYKNITLPQTSLAGDINLEDIIGATDIPVLDFRLHLSWVSKPW